MIAFCIKFSGHLPYMKASHLIMFPTKSLILRGPGSYLTGHAKPARSKGFPAAKRLRPGDDIFIVIDPGNYSVTYNLVIFRT